LARPICLTDRPSAIVKAVERADLTGRTALVTGANRGIGYETALGIARLGARVIVGARRPDAGNAAAEAITEATGAEVFVEPLDVADPDSVDALVARVDAVDVLINNAGIYPTAPILAVDEATLADALEIHVVGPWRLCKAYVPGMRSRDWGRVVNVSSSIAQMCDSVPGPGAYGLSKAALNALTKQVAADAGPRVLVNAACPGWVATAMGGPGAPRTPAEGADTVLWLASLPDGGPTGGFYQDRRPISF